MLKALHNDKVSLGWAIAVEIIVHAFFAGQAFLLGDFLGEIALASVFGAYLGGVIGAGLLALFLFGASFQAFVLGEYMREHVESYERATGKQGYLANWALIKWLVGGIELASLLFRCGTIVAKDGNWGQAITVALLGLVSLWYAFAQAKVIHASVNRPLTYDMIKARNQVGKSLVTDTLKLAPRMTADQKVRFLKGDTTPLDELYQSELSRRQEKLQDKKADKEAEEEHKRQVKAAKRQEREERLARQRRQNQEQDEEERVAQSFITKFLGGSDDDENQLPFLKAVPNDNRANRNGA